MADKENKKEEKEEKTKVTKEQKVEEKEKTETKKKEEKKTTEKETKVEVSEEVKVEKETVETEIVKEDKKEGSSRLIINIIAVVLILLTVALGLVLVFTKPSPKQAANDFLSLSIKNPKEAIIKYGISEFSEELEREKGKYTTYKITKIDDVVVEKGYETVKVYYTKKGPDALTIAEDVFKNLEEREITQNSENFNQEFLKEFKKLLKERKDQLEEVEDTITLQRHVSERNWTVYEVSGY